jgi:acyl carrier protein
MVTFRRSSPRRADITRITMTNDEQLVAVRRAFSKVFGQQIAFEPGLSRITEPRWTSLKHVEFIIQLECELGVRFDGADATDMTSIAAVLERVGRIAT